LILRYNIKFQGYVLGLIIRFKFRYNFNGKSLTLWFISKVQGYCFNFVHRLGFTLKFKFKFKAVF